MRKRFSISGLHKILGHEAVSSEVTHSHAYGKVARTHRSIPRARHAPSPRGSTVASYRDSMVGSIAQYRDSTPLPQRAKEKDADVHPADNSIGNRPQSKMADKDSASDALAKRHHFIEPPKPKFNRFD